MGLFSRKKSSHPQSSGSIGGTSASVNIRNRSDDDSMQHDQGSHAKREFSKPPTSDKVMTVEEGTVTTRSIKSNSTTAKSNHHSENDDASTTSRKVHLIERQLRQRDTTISKLRQTMEATEKAQSQRISLLELQGQTMEASVKAQSELIVFLERQMQTMEASEKAQSDRISLMEMQVERLVESSARNSRVFQTMEASERVESERTDLLERQLQRLVGLSSSECAALHANKDPSLPLNLASRNNHHGVIEGNGSHHKDVQQHQEAKNEISALQELLARVVAEKDRLILKNDNLQSMLDSGDAHNYPGDGESSGMPPNVNELDFMISELDCMISQERKTNRWEDGKDSQEDQHLEFNDEWSQENDAYDDDHDIQHDPPVSSEEQFSVLYKLSCRDCPTDESDVNYVGRLTTDSDNTAQDLTDVVSHHYSRVWEMVQQQQDDGSISSSIHDGDSFPSSSLAIWLATEQCEQFTEEDEVLQWCMDNIKVEIKEDGGDATSPREKKKKRNKNTRKGRQIE